MGMIVKTKGLEYIIRNSYGRAMLRSIRCKTSTLQYSTSRLDTLCFVESTFSATFCAAWVIVLCSWYVTAAQQPARHLSSPGLSYGRISAEWSRCRLDLHSAMAGRMGVGRQKCAEWPTLVSMIKKTHVQNNCNVPVSHKHLHRCRMRSLQCRIIKC